MKKDKKRPNKTTYKSLLKALIASGQHNEVYELFKFSVYKGEVDKEMFEMVLTQCQDPQQVQLCKDLVSNLRGWDVFDGAGLENEKPVREFGFAIRTKKGNY